MTRERDEWTSGCDRGQRVPGVYIAYRPHVLEDKEVVVENDDVLPGLRVGDNVITGDIDDTTCFDRKDLVALGIDEGELLLHPEQVLLSFENGIPSASVAVYLFRIRLCSTVYRSSERSTPSMSYRAISLIAGTETRPRLEHSLRARGRHGQRVIVGSVNLIEQQMPSTSRPYIP